MELYVEPTSAAPNDPMEDETNPKPDSDSPMEDPPPPVEPPPLLPSPKEWKPYEPMGGRYGTTYALKHGEQLTEP